MSLQDMMDSMHKPQTDEVARGPGTGESMAVRDFIQGTPGLSGSLFCYLGQEFQYFERFSYLRLCSSVRCASIYSLTGFHGNRTSRCDKIGRGP